MSVPAGLRMELENGAVHAYEIACLQLWSSADAMRSVAGGVLYLAHYRR